MNPPRIVLIGAGSFFFGLKAIWALNHLPGFRGATLALVDTDARRLEAMRRLAEMVAEDTGSGVRVEAFDGYRAALPGADFVILSFSIRNAHYRRIDCEVSARYGIRMCSGDTIGPGGVFRAARELPMILEICREVERVAPEAWVINYVNPSAVMGIALMRHAQVLSFALCDTHHLPWKRLGYLDLIGEPRERAGEFDLRIAGVNHFTWILKAELAGEDVRGRIRDAHAALAAAERDEGYSKARFNHFITAQLADVFGAVPTCTGHTKEYVPFYQGRSALSEPVPPLSVFDCSEREEKTATMWREVDEYLSGVRSVAEFRDRYQSDHATDIIHTMVVEDGRTYFVNRSNSHGLETDRPVGNLPADAFLELECRIDRHGPRPLPVGDFPSGLRGLQAMILDVHEVTVEAIVRRDKALLARALAMDPLVNSIATANAVIDDLFAREAEVLGEWSDGRRAVIGTGTPAAGATGEALY